jgi:hypothetical protein
MKKKTIRVKLVNVTVNIFRVVSRKRPRNYVGHIVDDYSDLRWSPPRVRAAFSFTPRESATRRNDWFRKYRSNTGSRSRSYPSETQVKRGGRIVHGNKELREKLGRNDLCPCGSGRSS